VLGIHREEMDRGDEWRDRRSWLFLNLNPPLISKLDLM